MMKTMMSADGNTVVYVSDDQASRLYHEDGFRYVDKSMLKEKSKDIKSEKRIIKK